MRWSGAFAGLAVLSTAATALVVTATAAVPVAARGAGGPPPARARPGARPRPGALGAGRRRVVPRGRPAGPSRRRRARPAAAPAARPGQPAGRSLPPVPRPGGEGARRRPARRLGCADGVALLSVDAGSRAAARSWSTCGPAAPVRWPCRARSRTSRSDPAATACSRRRTAMVAATAGGCSRSTGPAASGPWRPASGRPCSPSEDGTLLVTGPVTARGRSLGVLDGASGEVVREVATPLSCVPSRWWEPGVVAARCWGSRQRLELWLVPLDGSAPTQLSTYHGRRSADLGDLDARELGGRTYLQASGSCGYAFLARQEADGSATTIDVPGAVGSVRLVDATDSALVVQHAVSCDGGRSRWPRSPASTRVTSAERVLTTLARGPAVRPRS